MSLAAFSAAVEAAVLVGVGSAATFAPRTTHAIFNKCVFSGTLTPLGTHDFYFRLFGAFGMAYTGLWYAVAAYNDYTAFFKVSVWTRCLALPLFNVSLVAAGLTSTAWLEFAIPFDLLAGLHMHSCLQRDAATKRG